MEKLAFDILSFPEETPKGNSCVLVICNTQKKTAKQEIMLSKLENNWCKNVSKTTVRNMIEIFRPQ